MHKISIENSFLLYDPPVLLSLIKTKNEYKQED